MKPGLLEKNRSEILIIAALTAVSAALRFRPLRDPLWGDEAVTYSRHGAAPLKELLFYYLDPNQHTLFSILSNFCISLFGENELWFRFPAFLAGVLALPLFYRLGICFLDSKAVSLLASCLLVFSKPHLSYSYNGRGYTLTFFLALILVLSVTKIVQKANTIGWGALLIFSGFCLVLTLPTNAFFLAGAAGYGFALKWEMEKKLPAGIFSGWSRVLVPFSMLLAMVVGYFYIIYPGLASGVKNVSPYVAKGASYFSETAEFLMSPWGSWCYIFFIVGVISLKSKKLLFPFLALFIIPLSLTLATGLIGYARVYTYWLPFVLMAVAQGMVTVVAQTRKYSSPAGYGLLAALVAAMSFAPARSLPGPSESRDTSIADAKLALAYVQEKIPHDHLLLVPSRNYVLNRYLGDRIKADMFGFINGAKPEKVNYLLHKDLSPGAQVFEGYFPGSEVRLPAHSFKPVATIGNLRLYELNLKIFRFIPPAHDPDYENQLGFQSPHFISANEPRVLGLQVLAAKQRNDPVAQYASPIVKSVDIRGEDAYTLAVYIRKYGQKSKMFLGEYDEKNWPPAQMAYLNTYLGEFGTGNPGFKWQMIFVIAPVGKGRHNFQEFIQLEDEIGYFDAFQSFLLLG